MFVATDRHFPLYRTAIPTRMRRGELRALRWDDLDFDNGRPTVRRALVDDQDAAARTAASFDEAAELPS